MDLEVGLDTFRPITTDHVGEHTIHRERYRLPMETAERVEETREGGGQGGRRRHDGGACPRDRRIRRVEGSSRARARPTCSSFPDSVSRVVDLLVTNFHLPRSTLVALIAAFIGPGWRRVYATALRRGYRFLSFGDAMLAARQ